MHARSGLCDELRALHLVAPDVDQDTSQRNYYPRNEHGNGFNQIR